MKEEVSVTTGLRKDTMQYNGIDVLNYTIRYPVFHSDCNPAASAWINEYYSEKAEKKEQYSRLALYPQAVDVARYIKENDPPFNAYEFSVNYTIALNKGCMVSLFMDEYNYMGGAHGLTVRTSDTWDFSKGRRITLKELYGADPSYKGRIIEDINNQISGLLKLKPQTFFEDYEKLVQNTFHPESFFLTPEGIVIYFQQYDIAPYAAGFPEFPVHSV